MEDLSALAQDSMWVTSQAGGNMQSGRPAAMSAPGSPPVDPLPPANAQGDPHVVMAGPQRPPGEDGKPQPGTYAPNPVRWGPAGSPGVSRET